MTTWGETRRCATDDRDIDPDRHELHVGLGGNGDWYLSVLPEGHKLGPTVRISTSGGAEQRYPGIGVALADLYRVLGRQPIDRSLRLEIVAAPADRGRLINAKATAGAHVVDAKDALAKARGVVEQERARVRLAQAEAAFTAAERELAAAEGAEI